MPLGFTYSSGADFIPTIKYDARRGRILRVDRVQEKGTWTTFQTDITEGFEAVVDADNITAGWVLFAQGAKPEFHLVPAGRPLPRRPSPQHNQAARFMLKLAPACAGDSDPVRECVATAAVFLQGLDQFYNSCLAQQAANPGKLPVVKLKNTLPVTTGHGPNRSTNYQPVFEIIGWTERPDDLVFVPKATAAV